MDIRIEFSATSYILAALLFLTLPISWIIAALTAAMIHELFHIMSVLVSGGKIDTVSIGINGAVISTSYMSISRQLYCILAGPTGSLLLMLTAKYMPKLAVCGLIQGMFNLLPLYPLDGGRAFLCIMEYLFPSNTAEIVCYQIGKMVILIAICLGFWASFVKKLGVLPIMIPVMLAFRVCHGKKSCKERDLGVQ